ncbi:MAG: adenylate/guanylate cyclase domain-containing protein [Polyangiaceae bacterium]
MRCGACTFENPEGMRFCGKCGSSLSPRCASCGFESPPGFRFCGKCGTSLEAPAETPPPPPSILQGTEFIRVQDTTSVPDGPVSVAERRQVTVLFCDLVGSTQLSERLDPEELREVVQAYQAAASEVVERYEGHVAQYLGDGLLVYFGYPRAQEDAARRAVLSALAIIDGIQVLNEELERERSLKIAVRIGIHTGSGVVGDVGGKTKREQLVIGNTPNVAARLQGLAEPDTVVISAVTHLLTGDYFVCESLGPQSLKGVSTPLEALRVTGERRAGDLSGELRGEATPFVGRNGDLAVLRARFAKAGEGHGQAVLLTGDPGIGKSRLVTAFRAEVGAQIPWMTFRCSPYATNTAFFPLVEPIAQLCGIDPDARPEERIERLDAWIEAAEDLGPEAPALLAALLAVPWSADRPRPSLTPQQERDATLKLLTRVLLDRAAAGRVVLVFEDLHWIDPSTLAFVQGLLTAITTERVLLLLATRPSFSPPWQPAPNIARIDLGKLADADAEQIVLRLSGGKPIPDVVLRQILDKCDGVPLFIEELTKAVLESGLLADAGDRMELSQPFASPEIPVTLQDSLTARLDRMGSREGAPPARVSAVGRRFVYELLAAVAAVDEATLRERLQRLVNGEPSTASPRLGTRPSSSSTPSSRTPPIFAMMLKSTRRSIHEKIARVIEERFTETADLQPELLARHFEEAQILDRAVDHHHRRPARDAAPALAEGSPPHARLRAPS